MPTVLKTKVRRTSPVTSKKITSSPAIKKTVKRAPASVKATVAGAGTEVTTSEPEKKTRAPRERDQYGITIGTDQSRVLAEMIEGGESKSAVKARCDEMFKGETTTGGMPKPTSTIVNQLIRILLTRGFRIESTWRLVPPDSGSTTPPAAEKKTIAKTPAKRIVKRTNAKPGTELALAEAAGLVEVPAKVAPKKRVFPSKGRRSKASS